MDWDFARYSPGILAEYALLDTLAKRDVTFSHFDSGAPPGSYLEELWQGRTDMLHLYITRGPTAHIFLTAWELLRHGKQKLQSAWSRSDTA